MCDVVIGIIGHSDRYIYTFNKQMKYHWTKILRLSVESKHFFTHRFDFFNSPTISLTLQFCYGARPGSTAHCSDNNGCPLYVEEWGWWIIPGDPSTVNAKAHNATSLLRMINHAARLTPATDRRYITAASPRPYPTRKTVYSRRKNVFTSKDNDGRREKRRSS